MAMNEAMERGLHQNFQYKSRRFGIAKESSATIYLNQSEIRGPLAVDLFASRSFERVRDSFVASCFSGLRHGDLSALMPEQIKDGYITITQKKTDHEILIPIHPVVTQILKKYKGRLPKPVSNSLANVYLKEVGQRCPDLDVNVSKSFTKGLQEYQDFQKMGAAHHPHCQEIICNERILGRYQHGNDHGMSGHKSSAAFKSHLRLTPPEHAGKMKNIWATRNQLKAI